MNINKKVEHPLVSILIASFNHENYIEEALNSVLSDTYSNKEIIIIDDGSSDNSVDIIENWLRKYEEKINVTFKHRQNKGVCATANELLDMANGQYILFLPSDDLLLNNTIAERVEILELNPSKLVLLSDAQVIDSEGNIIYESMMSDFHKADKNKYKTDENIIDELIFRFSISGPVLFVNKKIYDIIGKYPVKLKAEDLYFYIRTSCLRKILFWDKKVGSYRWHSKNVSNDNPELTKAILYTYIKTLPRVPTFYRKLKLLKRMIGIVYINIRN